MDTSKTKKIVSLYISIDNLEYLREKEVSPSHLLTSAIAQLRAQEMFIDPEYEWDNNYLFTQVVKHREKIAKLALINDSLSSELETLKGEGGDAPDNHVLAEKTI